jgi:hypothetical protein
MELTAEYLRTEFYYSSELGKFFRRFEHQGRAPWAECGYTARKGYRQMRVAGRAYCVHRLAWLYMTGEWPKHQIDHKNRVVDDNRWCNLRDVSQSANKLNCGMYRNNKSGFRGVSWYEPSRKWLAQITRGGKRKHIGYFDSPEEAHEAFLAAGGHDNAGHRS